MFEMIRKALSYLNWFSLVVFFLVAGVVSYPVKSVVGIIFFVVSLCLLFVVVERCSKKYSPEQRVGSGKPVGDLILDVLILGSFVPLYSEMAGRWMPIFVAGVVMVAIDFVLQLLYRYGDVAQKCRA